MSQPAFFHEMSVRDYECDLQGIVNNAVYQNYLEHARHVYFRQFGIDFAEITARGIYLVVIRAELDYRWPLRSGDAFRVSVRMGKVSRLRFAFWQSIERCGDDKPILDAKIVCTGFDRERRPVIPPEIAQAIQLGSDSGPSSDLG